jgi:hypothetical protein
MALRFKLQLVVVTDDEQQVCVDEIVLLNKEHERVEQLGLSLAEAKTLLLEVQRQILGRQIAAFLASRVACPSCGRARGIKDHKTISFRTLFGRLELASPRLRRCPCQHTGPGSTSPLVDLVAERTTPELLYLESKWASLVSYGLTVQALQDFLPVDARLNATSVRRRTLQVARRCEAELGPEPRFPLAGCPSACASLPTPQHRSPSAWMAATCGTGSTSRPTSWRLWASMFRQTGQPSASASSRATTRSRSGIWPQCSSARTCSTVRSLSCSPVARRACASSSATCALIHSICSTGSISSCT